MHQDIKENIESISFLIGSGFSVPADLPTTSQINERLKKIDASSISVDGGDARFLKGHTNPNSNGTSTAKRKFVQEFLEFYNENVLKGDEEFHYEKFFDYYIKFLNNNNYSDDLSKFLNNFLIKQKIITNQQNPFLEHHQHDLLLNFHLNFNQLIKDLLTKPFERCHLCGHPRYDAFLNLVESLSKDYVVNLHSLNHDLCIEYISISDSIQAKLDDGFEELGSPYYGVLRDFCERYKVRLPIFKNKFEQPFRLYKLHGSIDRYWLRENNQLELIKLKKRVGKMEVFKEVKQDGKLLYIHTPLGYPDFLSGITAKREQYGLAYYSTIFRHFEENLKSSKNLIIIGYGFGDPGIDTYFKFSTNHHKRIFIIDIKEPATELLKRENVYFVNGGVEKMDIRFILDNLSK